MRNIRCEAERQLIYEEVSGQGIYEAVEAGVGGSWKKVRRCAIDVRLAKKDKLR